MRGDGSRQAGGYFLVILLCAGFLLLFLELISKLAPEQLTFQEFSRVSASGQRQPGSRAGVVRSIGAGEGDDGSGGGLAASVAGEPGAIGLPAEMETFVAQFAWEGHRGLAVTYGADDYNSGDPLPRLEIFVDPGDQPRFFSELSMTKNHVDDFPPNREIWFPTSRERLASIIAKWLAAVATEQC